MMFLLGYVAFVVVCLLVQAHSDTRSDKARKDNYDANDRIKKKMGDVGIDFTAKEQSAFNGADAEGKTEIYDNVLDSYEPNTAEIDGKLTIMHKALEDVNAARSAESIEKFDWYNRERNSDAAAKVFRKVKMPSGDPLEGQMKQHKLLYDAYRPGGTVKDFKPGNDYLQEARMMVIERITELEKVRKAELKRT